MVLPECAFLVSDETRSDPDQFRRLKYSQELAARVWVAFHHKAEYLGGAAFFHTTSPVSRASRRVSTSPAGRFVATVRCNRFRPCPVLPNE